MMCTYLYKTSTLQLNQPITSILFLQLLFKLAVNMQWVLQKDNVECHKNVNEIRTFINQCMTSFDQVAVMSNHIIVWVLTWPFFMKMELLKCLKQVSLNVKEHSQHNFIERCLWLKFYSWGTVECLPWHASWFSCWLKIVTSHLTACHNPPWKCIILGIIQPQMFHTLLLICVSMDVGPTGNTPYISRILYNCVQCTNADIQFHLNKTNGPMSAFMQSILNSHNCLWISEMVNPS